MSLEKAVRLVLDSVWVAQGGEVMITKMPVARIEDIAHVMRDALAPNRAIEITEVGAKPGEKMYEELMNDEEVRRTYEYRDFFITLSAFADANAPEYAYLLGLPGAEIPYNSSNERVLSREALRSYLFENELRNLEKCLI